MVNLDVWFSNGEHKSFRDVVITSVEENNDGLIKFKTKDDRMFIVASSNLNYMEITNE